MSDLPRLYLDGVALSAYTTQQIMDWGRLCQKEVGDELAAEQQKRAADAAQYQADEIEWNEQLAAAQATIEQMREALKRCTKFTQEDYDALTLQPCPEVLNKVRAEAVREFGKAMDIELMAEEYAQQIELGKQ